MFDIEALGGGCGHKHCRSHRRHQTLSKKRSQKFRHNRHCKCNHNKEITPRSNRTITANVSPIIQQVKPKIENILPPDQSVPQRKQRTRPCFAISTQSPLQTQTPPYQSPSPPPPPPSPTPSPTQQVLPYDTVGGPTILIAPEDYVHIYKGKTTEDLNEIPKDIGRIESEINNNSVDNQKMNTQQQQQKQPEIDNTPTILIAPKDYVHIYKQPKS
ncbi:hypothetical protein DERP_008202 [Dermatophagoides pteronyssinus]|uniref:Uncharacterized protein n=1 Tax=Dermatophagoides pteronyssinus TaxID=6956 RepID=A0ABQ8JKL3_DERPT|nr:hypothetical protein DERP_008202 [Dermatophagoides pteronyssinus]